MPFVSPLPAPSLRLVAALTVAAALPALALLAARAPAPRPPKMEDVPVPDPALDPDPEPMAQLLRALDEAHANCQAADAVVRGCGLPRGGASFRTAELEAALLDNPWVADRALGEADTLLREAAWLAALRPDALPPERSWEDVRFLLGGIHWYLERAWDAAARSEEARRAHPSLAGALAGVPLPAPARHPDEDYDREALRAYRDLETFEDLLGIWD